MDFRAAIGQDVMEGRDGFSNPYTGSVTSLHQPRQIGMPHEHIFRDREYERKA
jgi:hypothetical protein